MKKQIKHRFPLLVAPLFALLIAPFLFVSSVFAASATYDVDSSHSYIGFSVKHLMISKVKGRFTDLAGSFNFNEKGKTIEQATAIIQAASINTEKTKRDNHLRSPDFFDVEKFPTITFTQTGKSKLKGDELEVTGNITIHGVSKSIVLKGEFGGSIVDPWGENRVAFSAQGKLNRKDFGLTWNKALEAGGVVVGDKITLILEIEGVKQKE